ncbi:hypothetical protein HRbin08_00600 [bacterium HR08]|nr:hypothetical protein HRbin08_00600 [bacterium HR08]
MRGRPPLLPKTTSPATLLGVRQHAVSRSPFIRRLLHGGRAHGVLLLLLLLPACTPRMAVRPRVPTFAQLIAQLSEEGGYFPSDNLISNELG